MKKHLKKLTPAMLKTVFEAEQIKKECREKLNQIDLHPANPNTFIFACYDCKTFFISDSSFKRCNCLTQLFKYSLASDNEKKE
ncbi:MAG: hypothetical protein KA968_08115 [Chitinophagaceae bacterium]|jgi:hypothetical protein|nr:hypothetical protein [Chitinophagaceae bacterium]